MNTNPARHIEQTLLSRRRFLLPLVFAPFWQKRAGLLASQASDAAIEVSQLLSLRTLLTPNQQFFVRNHFTEPHLSGDSKLRVAGQVISPFEIAYAELARQSTRRLTVTLECAGNGVGTGGVSTATWEGVPLVTLLKRAGIGSGVKHVRLVGADRGIEGSQTPISFTRSISLEKASHPDTLVAFRMNGEPLPAEHGYPLRAIVPGWYGMDSVKWLVGIEALDQADAGYFMTYRYVAIRLETIGSDQVPVTQMLVKSLIVEPQEGAITKPGVVTIRGVAWAGENRVAQVEVSPDGGKSWAIAILDKEVRAYTWVRWSYPWEVRTTGAYVLMARATDDRGITQPETRDKLRVDSYELNWYQSTRCEIR